MRVLFVSGEVAPFTEETEIATLVRRLPDMVHETHGVETRIMMPRYGIVNERRNRLHEVIRLSSNDIPVGVQREQLNVKVASIPGIRLQVYFMDSNRLFKRKGIFADRTGKHFEDNPERAAFFARAVIETIRNLGWSPDVVHAFGWMSGFVPMLLRTTFTNDSLFVNSKIVYTPFPVDFDGTVAAEAFERFGFEPDERVVSKDLNVAGRLFSDAVILPASMDAEAAADRYSSDELSNVELTMQVYERVQAGVPA